MMTGIELRIFNLLTSFRTAEDVARDIGAHPGNTRRFLDALVTIDLLEKRNGLYRNMPVSDDLCIEVAHRGDAEGFSIDLHAGEIAEFVKVGKGAFVDFLNLRGFQFAVPVFVKIVDDHVAEHFVENPLLPEAGQPLFIELHNDRPVNPHMGMARSLSFHE
jgi:hypothetical protein